MSLYTQNHGLNQCSCGTQFNDKNGSLSSCVNGSTEKKHIFLYQLPFIGFSTFCDSGLPEPAPMVENCEPRLDTTDIIFWRNIFGLIIWTINTRLGPIKISLCCSCTSSPKHVSHVRRLGRIRNRGEPGTEGPESGRENAPLNYCVP